MDDISFEDDREDAWKVVLVEKQDFLSRRYLEHLSQQVVRL